MPGGQHAPELTDKNEIQLWEELLAHQNESMRTSGRGSRPGVEFSYHIRGAEMFVSNREKSITRSTILYAYRKVRELQESGAEIKGPKTIGVHGDSYIFAIFKKIGVIRETIL